MDEVTGYTNYSNESGFFADFGDHDLNEIERRMADAMLKARGE